MASFSGGSHPVGRALVLKCGFKAIHTLRKGQARAFQFSPGIQGEARLIERGFHLGPNPMAEMLACWGHQIEAILANSA